MRTQQGHYLMLWATKNNVLQQKVRKVKVWEAIEAITNVLNHVAQLVWWTNQGVIGCYLMP
jgi:hypothetical protein